jgi:hypothetical protein
MVLFRLVIFVSSVEIRLVISEISALKELSSSAMLFCCGAAE